MALYLAAAGIGKLLLADGDSLDITNLQRQILFDTDSAGEQKAELAEERLSGLNPEIELEAIDQALTEEDLEEYVPEVDLVLDCSDNLKTTQGGQSEYVSRRAPPLLSAARHSLGRALDDV